VDDSPACTRRVDQSLFLTIFKAHVTGGSAVVLRLLLRLLLTTTSRPTGARRPYVWSTETTRVVGALLQRVGCAVAHTGNEPPGVSNRSFGGSVRRHEPRHNLPVRSLELARRYELNANGSPVDAISCKKYLAVHHAYRTPGICRPPLVTPDDTGVSRQHDNNNDKLVKNNT